MNRVDRLPDNYIPQYLSDLESGLAELKSSSQFAGGASVVYKQVDTGAPYDWSGVLPYGGGVTPLFEKFLVTATATTQAVLLADLIWYIWVDGVRKTKADAFNPYIINPLPKASSTTNAQQWYVYVSWDTPGAVVSVKAYVLATDVATLNVQAL